MLDTSYRFSTPTGEVVADDSMLAQKFVVAPSEPHKFLTLGDFFDCIKRFLLSEKEPRLSEILSRLWHRPVRVEEIDGIVVRYEKYGTLYQICSIDISAGGDYSRMCVNVAFSEHARLILTREFDLIALLEEKARLGFLPRVYKKDWIHVEKAGRKETFLAALLEWFEGYEEWHFKQYDVSTRAFLWDMRKGYRFLSRSQTFDIVSQAAYILTLYYDVPSSRRITPWHHGGGDFIVRASETCVDLKLITARGYAPLRSSEDEGTLETLCSFCIETITKMRLDKWEGMGGSEWADRFVVEAALQGFFQGLTAKEARGEMDGLPAAAVLQRLKSFDVDQLRSLVKSQFVDADNKDFSDYMAVLRNLDVHASEIYTAIQSVNSLLPSFPAD
jgi:hypothetical protein